MFTLISFILKWRVVGFGALAFTDIICFAIWKPLNSEFLIHLLDIVSPLGCYCLNQMEVLPFKGKACWQVNHNLSESNINTLSIEDYIKATIIMFITVAVISLNGLMILVLHSKNYSRYLRDLPRILMTSLSLTDLAVGTLVTPISFISIINDCWPWSQTVCAIEALLIAALFHESTLSLLCIAIDRYICIVHPLRYHSLMTKKVKLLHNIFDLK